mgnify:FL=1
MKLKLPTGRKERLIALGAAALLLIFIILICLGIYKLCSGTEIDSELFVERKYDQRNPIERHATMVDTLLLRPRNPLTLTNAQGERIKRRVTSVKSFRTSFPDLNDVQLATARRLGIPHIADREEAAHRKEELVYIGDNPFYEVRPLSHSIPYLIPRAATLLTDISRAFIDSLASKGYPFHKLVVTSVLRTQKDIKKLRHVTSASNPETEVR